MVDINKSLKQMDEFLYNKIMIRVSKVVKKSINEAYSEDSIYDKIYTSFDELKILNDSGNPGDILLANLFNEYRVKRSNLNINESIFDGDMFDNDNDLNIVDKLLVEWKDIPIVCVGTGLWAYLDWIGLHKELSWAKLESPLYRCGVQTSENGYKNTLFILNNYYVKDTLWDEVKKCKYPVFIPSNEQLKVIRKYRKLLSLSNEYYWSSSLCANPYRCGNAFGVYLNNGRVNSRNKTYECRSVALLHFK